MSAGAPEVSVIVAVLDEVEHIERTAHMIAAQDFSGDVEFLFLDGGSRDGTREFLTRFADRDPRLRILDNPGRTQVRALNAGLRHARAEIVVQMDAHTYYEPDYLSVGVARLRRGDAGWVSGPPVPVGEGRWSRRVALALSSRAGAGGADKWRAGSGAEEVELDTGVFAGFWLRSTLERLGGWNDDWPVNHDAELAARYLAAGGRIVCVPQLAARYVPRNSLSGLGRQYHGYGYYRAGTCRYHPDSMRPSHVLSLAPALAVLSALQPWAPLRRLGLAAAAVYTAAMSVASLRLAPDPKTREAPALLAVFATMHFSWGLGFLRGCRRFGIPWQGIASSFRRLAATLKAMIGSTGRGG